jgi:hypothetical protein
MTAFMGSRSVDPDLGELGRIEAPDGLEISGMIASAFILAERIIEVVYSYFNVSTGLD